MFAQNKASEKNIQIKKKNHVLWIQNMYCIFSYYFLGFVLAGQGMLQKNDILKQIIFKRHFLLTIYSVILKNSHM